MYIYIYIYIYIFIYMDRPTSLRPISSRLQYAIVNSLYVERL